MEFGVLGPLRAVAADGSEVPLGGPKQRSVLALLLVHADRIVDVDRIIEELWPEATSDASRKTVQAYVSRLRSVFANAGAAEVIEARAGGYILVADEHVIDARQFEFALAAARNSSTSEPASHDRPTRGEPRVVARTPVRGCVRDAATGARGGAARRAAARRPRGLD